MPVTTSKTECCLISMVERMMDSANMPDAIRMLFPSQRAVCEGEMGAHGIVHMDAGP